MTVIKLLVIIIINIYSQYTDNRPPRTIDRCEYIAVKIAKN